MHPGRGKRRKRIEESVSGNASTSSATSVIARLIYLDEELFRKWAEGQSEQNIEVLSFVLNGLCDLLSYRCNESMRRSILHEFIRCMSIHGVPYRYVLNLRASKFLAREEYDGKYPATKDINQFFRALSDLEYGLRANIWSFLNVQMGALVLHSTSPLVQKSTSIQRLRHQLSMASRRLNYKAVATQLANSEVLRMASETIEKRTKGWKDYDYQIQFLIYYDSPIAFFMALQSSLAMEHDSSFDIGNRLLLLASVQAMVYTTKSAKNTIMMQLCEVLIAALLCGHLTHVSGILALERRIHRYNKVYDSIAVWNAYKLIAEYEEWRGRAGYGGMILNTAQALLEVAESDPPHGTIFLETACKIWVKLGRHEDKIAEAVSSILRKCPQLLGRVIAFLKSIDHDDDVEVVIEEVCDAERSGLHASDEAWVDWCQPRIARPEKYGQRLKVLERCTDVLFKFLDYGSNRENGRAWVLLHTAVQFVEPSYVTRLWLERYDWWPRFHMTPLPPEAASRRSQLLAALAEMPVE
ncbi:unnamed protein product [Cylicocyclus nassatus]|uniref:Uncharacterized protein n=1 Tax=Cylicocyclus nassatus TaxID=53992 RepID=A0AA36H0J6_CYLNA|nr:unnamed protein product [Cylicocyclus nassatus]